MRCMKDQRLRPSAPVRTGAQGCAAPGGARPGAKPSRNGASRENGKLPPPLPRDRPYRGGPTRRQASPGRLSLTESHLAGVSGPSPGPAPARDARRLAGQEDPVSAPASERLPAMPDPPANGARRPATDGEPGPRSRCGPGDQAGQSRGSPARGACLAARRTGIAAASAKPSPGAGRRRLGRGGTFPPRGLKVDHVGRPGRRQRPICRVRSRRGPWSAAEGGLSCGSIPARHAVPGAADQREDPTWVSCVDGHANPALTGHPGRLDGRRRVGPAVDPHAQPGDVTVDVDRVPLTGTHSPARSRVEGWVTVVRPFRSVGSCAHRRIKLVRAAPVRARRVELPVPRDPRPAGRRVERKIELVGSGISVRGFGGGALPFGAAGHHRAP